MQIAGVLIFLVIAVGIVAIIIIRRKRLADESTVLPDIGDPIDYTSLPEETPPPSLRDRLETIPLPAKIALIAAPVVILGLIIIVLVVQSLFSGGETSATPPVAEQPPSPPSITITKADVVSASSIRVEATTAHLADGVDVQVELLSGSEPFPWFDPNSAKTKVEGGRIELRLNKAADSASPTQGMTFTVQMKTTSGDKQVTAQRALEIPPSIPEFFAALPTPTFIPEPIPTEEPTPEITQTVEEEPTPTEQPLPRITVRVDNGGNVRGTPGGEPIIDQINANETVELLEKTSDGKWYKIKNQRDKIGWSHHTLLNKKDLDAVVESVPVASETADQTPTSEIAPVSPDTLPESTGLKIKVAWGGNVRAKPDKNSAIRSQAIVNEQVELFEKTSQGTWYHVKTEQNVVGWIHASLLDEKELSNVASQVPVAK